MVLSTAGALRALISLPASASDSRARRRVGAARPSRRSLRCPGSLARRCSFANDDAPSGWVVEPSPADPSCPFDWWKDAVVYQIFPDRFAPDPAGLAPGTQVDAWGSPPTIRSFQGGSLRGITANLDHIQSLGVNTLYTTPVFLSTANHRCHPSDFMKWTRCWAARTRCASSWRRATLTGSLVLDGAFNHTAGAPGVRPLLDAQEQSPYKDWFLPKSFPVRGVRRRGTT